MLSAFRCDRISGHYGIDGFAHRRVAGFGAEQQQRGVDVLGQRIIGCCSSSSRFAALGQAPYQEASALPAGGPAFSLSASFLIQSPYDQIMIAETTPTIAKKYQVVPTLCAS